MSDVSAPRVRVITREGCHLCDVALTVIEEVCAELREDFEELDLFSDPEFVKYVNEIPVTLVDGKPHDFWRVNPDRLRKALSG